MIIQALTVTLTLKSAHQSLCMSQAHDDASLYQARLQKVQQFRSYLPDKHSLKFWTFAVSLPLKKAIQTFCKTLWQMMMYNDIKFGCKRISSSETVKLAHQLFPTTFWLMMMLHHTKFGDRRLTKPRQTDITTRGIKRIKKKFCNFLPKSWSFLQAEEVLKHWRMS